MFLTAKELVMEYGIDKSIAKFYVDREPPKDNLYWKDKLLYLRSRPGYIFLPLISDLYLRSGISMEILLGEDYVQLLEKIGHYAAQQEFGMISYNEVQQASRKLVEPYVKNQEIFDEINRYFDGKENSIQSLNVPFKALHRGDVFLYSLCALEIGMPQFLKLVTTWFALISTLLLMDDAEDYLADLASKDENAFVESGSNRQGFAAIEAMIEKNIHHLRTVNQEMANTLQKKLSNIGEKPGIKEYLNA